MLVVGQADCVCADLLNQGHVLLMFFRGQGPAHVQPVLMAGNAVQRVALAVQEEPALGVHMEAAEAEGLGHGVLLGAVGHKAQPGGVQVGVGPAVPQVRVFHLEVQHGVAFGRGFGFGHRAAFGVGQHGLDGAARGPHREGVDPHAARCARRDKHAGGAAFEQVKMGGGDLNELHGAVQPAEEGEVGHLGVNVGRRVGDLHGQDVFAVGQRVGQLKPEGGKTAAVGAQFPPVAVNGGDMVGALEFNVLFAAGGAGGQRNVVAADAAPIAAVILAVLAVKVVPGVGQADFGRRVALLGKKGFGQTGDGAHTDSPFFVKFCQKKANIPI